MKHATVAGRIGRDAETKPMEKSTVTKQDGGEPSVPGVPPFIRKGCVFVLVATRNTALQRGELRD